MPIALDTVDLRQLRLFMAIVEAGGFAAAQGELDLSLSTISGHVAALEARLGMRLCRRGRAGFALTGEGAQVYEEARRLTAALEQFEARVAGVRSALRGTLSVGLVDNTISDPAAPLERAFAAFAAAAPDVVLRLVTRPPGELLRDVIAGQLHLAIASFPRAALGLSYAPLYAERHNIHCGASHPLFDVPAAQIDVGVLRAHAIVGRDYWGQRDLKLFAIGAPRAVVSDMEAEARLILSGAYLGYLPDHYARAFVAQGRMRALRPDLFGYTAPFAAAFDPAKARQPILRRFLAELLRALRPA